MPAVKKCPLCTALQQSGKHSYECLIRRAGSKAVANTIATGPGADDAVEVLRLQVSRNHPLAYAVLHLEWFAGNIESLVDGPQRPAAVCAAELARGLGLCAIMHLERVAKGKATP